MFTKIIRKKGNNRLVIAGILLLILLAAGFNITGCSGPVETIKLDLYIESQCPYGMQEVTQILPLIDKFGSALQVNIDYIATYHEDGTITSLHGQPEVDGDIIQLCVKNYNPDKYIKFISLMNKNPGAIPNNWEQCAADLGINPKPIQRCFDGEEGKELLRNSAARAYTAGAFDCPTTYINGTLYKGVASETELLRGICYSFKGGWPSACSSVPMPKTVRATLLNDKRCTDGCDIRDVVNKVKLDFPRLELTELDYGTEEGRRLYNEAGIIKLPAIIFDSSIEQSEKFGHIKRYLERAGKYYSLRLTVPFDPTREICDNGIDDTGNGAVDCEDEDCANSLKCTQIEPASVQLFIMSDDPFGRKGVNVLNEIVKSAGNSLKWDVRYFAEVHPNGNIKSLYGPGEVEEDEVRLLVKKYFPDKYLDFLVCRSKAAVATQYWQKCAREIGIDTQTIVEAYAVGEGAALLRADVESQPFEMKNYPSPTWLINNRYIVLGVNKDPVLAGICKYNSELGICGK